MRLVRRLHQLQPSLAKVQLVEFKELSERFWIQSPHVNYLADCHLHLNARSLNT